MRIGILTFHRAINYGAVLQCYALFKTLTDMGHDVEVIDYRSESIEKYRMFFRKKDFKKAKGFGKLRYLLSCVTLIPSKKKTSRKFDSFINRYLTTSQQVQDIDGMPKYYDAIFFGSDQIWSPEHCEGLDKVYFGQFVKGNTNYYAYAASIGKKEIIQGDIADDFGNYLLSFDRISVREIQVQEFIQSKYKIDVELVCDPTLLINAGNYISIGVKPKEDNYVLLFDLTNDYETLLFSKRVAAQIDAKVIEIKAVCNPIHKRSFIRSDISPEEFIGYIAKARCVVTNSFHATSFSILLQKDFYTLFRKSNNERSESLLNLVGLTYRMVNKNDNVCFSKIDYCDTHNNLLNYREKSLTFISNCLLMSELPFNSTHSI